MKIFKKKYIVPFLAIIGISGYYLKCSNGFIESLHYYGYYANTTGLQPGSLVTLRGVAVGKISDIDLTPNNDSIRVTIQMNNEDLMLQKGTVAQLVSNALMGGKELYLLPGSGDLLLESGSVLPTIRDTSLIEDYDAVMSPLITNAKYMLASFDTSLRGFNKLFFSGLGLTSVNMLITIDSNTRVLAKTAEGYNKRSGEIARSIHSFEESSKQMVTKSNEIGSTLRNVDSSLKNLKKQDITASAKKMFTSVSALSKNIKGYKESYDKQTSGKYKDLSKSLDSVNAQMKRLNENGR